MTYHKDFITKEEESKLIDQILSEEWLGDLKRRVQHYGWKYDYKARSLDYSMYLGSLPQWISVFSKRLVEHGMMTEEPDQVIINEYKPGQGIANHVDCEPCFGDTIISLSLSSACTMNFINLSSQEKKEVVLLPRSVVVIKGDARYHWSHGIPARLADQIDGTRINRKLRISMTFRKVISRD
ncbi:alpha-ketoglutarate-dependent dioxygenase AlkB [Pedobacter hiemivivus]|uniref:Alpha-ketoglutarate-dependent dioxygenase AlkB n=2 Tax=Pedobacter hiemivivus TaxID=2530454 RepID=A0A4R0NGN4_9SPHI|nr:alpha-ketoglutarate-dependent dioxygenase AlkB [Pedobacter hiemivivus]